MGVAAVQRGNAAISRQFQEDARKPEFFVLERLNAETVSHLSGLNFRMTDEELVLAKDPSCDVWWVLDPEERWEGFGYHYPKINLAIRDWHALVTGYDATRNEFTMTRFVFDRNDKQIYESRLKSAGGSK